MSYYRRRDSVRPSEPTTREKLETFVRTYPVPKDLTLDGLIDGLSPAEALARGRCFPPEKILEDAFGVYLKAFETFQRGSALQRAAVRGCTIEMLVLLIQQALDLHKRIEARGKEDAARTGAISAAQTKYNTDFSRAIALREQARRVLAAAMRDDAAAQEGVRRAALATDAGGAASAAMMALAEMGRHIIHEGDARAKQRAALLGLDEKYLDSLDDLGKELARTEAEIAKLTAESKNPHEEIFVDAGLTLHLMMHVIEAFSVARELDPTVPLLRPVFTQRVVRRLSKLPPPSPRAPNVRIEGLPTSGPEPKLPSDGPKIPIDYTFSGGLGRLPRK